jgi:GDP-mannose transporter
MAAENSLAIRRSNFVGAVAFYCFCSATMLVANKAAVVSFPFPNLLLCMQFVTSVVVPRTLGALGYLEVDGLELRKVLGFLKAVAVFFATLFTSMMALRDLNVDTVIVFRSSLPLAVAIGDFLFMQRELPSGRTWGALTLTLEVPSYLHGQNRSCASPNASGHFATGAAWWRTSSCSSTSLARGLN